VAALQSNPELLERVLADGGAELRQRVLESCFKQASSQEILSAADAFVHADMDGDGKLSASEFHTWYQRSLRRHGHSLSDPDIAYKMRNMRADGVGAAVATGAEPMPLAPTSQQLRALGLTAAVPFIAFGFLDKYAAN